MKNARTSINYIAWSGRRSQSGSYKNGLALTSTAGRATGRCADRKLDNGREEKGERRGRERERCILGLGFLQAVARLAGTFCYHNHNTKKEATGESGQPCCCPSHTHTHRHTYSQNAVDAEKQLRQEEDEDKPMAKLKRAARSIVIGSRCNNTYNTHSHTVCLTHRHTHTLTYVCAI